MNQLERDTQRLKHILEAIADIEQIAAGRREDKATFYAIERLVQIIGEAANHVSEQTQNKYQTTPWKEIVAMRNFIVHEYNKVDVVTVWDTVDHDIPTLKAQITEILNDITKT